MLFRQRLAFVLLTCLATTSLRAQAPPEFTPRAGFRAGPSEGNGELRLLGGRPRSLHVESYGFDRPDGRFQLDQTIAIQGRAPTTRSWVITTVAPNQYRATLTDAAGIVTGRTEGDTLYLDYRYKGPLFVHQKLVMRPDGRTIDNSTRMTLLGLPIGQLRETITRKN